jgi:hypothetical protein
MKHLKTKKLFEARDRDSIGKYKETFGYPFNLSMNEMSDIRDILLDIMDMGFEIRVGSGQYDINSVVNILCKGPYVFTIEKLDRSLDIWGNRIARIFNITDDMIEPILHLEDYLNKRGLNIMIPNGRGYRRGESYGERGERTSYTPLSEFIEETSDLRSFTKLQFKIVKLARK